MGVCNCSMFCCTLLYVHYSITIILMGKRELVALLNLSSWCLVMVVWLFLSMPWDCLRFVIVVFPDHTHLLFLIEKSSKLSRILLELPIYDLRRTLYYQGISFMDIFMNIISYFLTKTYVEGTQMAFLENSSMRGS